MNNSTKKYDLFSQMDSDKFFDFIIDLFDNMGMKKEGHEMELPIQCKYCPFNDDCTNLIDDELTCIEFLATKLK